MLHEEDDDTEAPVRQAYRGWCIVQVHADGSLTSRHTECEPWREWRNVLMHATLEKALARCQPGSVIVEVDGYGDDSQDVCIARLGSDAPLGQPRALWAICGDDVADAAEACEAYGISWMGVAADKEHIVDASTALWKFDREFRNQCTTTKWCMPRAHPFVLAAVMVVVMVLVAAAIMWWVASMPIDPVAPAGSTTAVMQQEAGTTPASQAPAPSPSQDLASPR